MGSLSLLFESLSLSNGINAVKLSLSLSIDTLLLHCDAVLLLFKLPSTLFALHLIPSLLVLHHLPCDSLIFRLLLNPALLVAGLGACLHSMHLIFLSLLLCIFGDLVGHLIGSSGLRGPLHLSELVHAFQDGSNHGLRESVCV